MKKLLINLLMLICAVCAEAQPSATTVKKNGVFKVGDTTTEPRAHDPCLVKEGSTYYTYYTGDGIQVWSSRDMKNWTKEPSIFNTAPEWVKKNIPGFKGLGFWAPDLSFHNGMWYLYYATSLFGTNNSVIGVATNKTLDPRSKNYKWTDRGMVLRSVVGRDQWNAIDPNLIVDNDGSAWLSFGSYWNGIKLAKLDAGLTSLAERQEWYTIASRPRDPKFTDAEPGNGAVEAPFIYKKNGYYYLFVSWDGCCAGIKSTYNIRIGRSTKIMGPYLDQEGKEMIKGGGTLLLGGDKGPEKVVYAVGHNSVSYFDNNDWIAYHAYTNTYERLVISKLIWENEWPKIR